MTKPDRPAPTLLGQLVAGARQDLIRSGGCPLDRHTWKQTFGERIAARSEPEQLRDGILTLRVVSSVWAQELSLLSATIIERLTPLGYVVRSVRCRVGKLDEGSKARVPTRTRAPAAAAVELPNELAQQLAQIGDIDLRTTIEHAARAQLQARAQRRLQPKGSAVAPPSREPRSK